MRRLFVLILLLGSLAKLNAQDTSVEKSFFGVQLGTIGLWIHNEAKLSHSIILRSEAGLDGGFSKNETFYFIPTISLEPRWYFTLNKRVEKSKDIRWNSGDFIALNFSYAPDWFVISHYDRKEVFNQVSIIPTIGIRRNLGQHFNYEAGFGVGYRYIFKNSEYADNESELAGNIHLRIGFRF